jgi:hypothetical protein
MLGLIADTAVSLLAGSDTRTNPCESFCLSLSFSWPLCARVRVNAYVHAPIHAYACAQDGCDVKTHCSSSSIMPQTPETSPCRIPQTQNGSYYFRLCVCVCVCVCVCKHTYVFIHVHIYVHICVCTTSIGWTRTKTHNLCEPTAVSSIAIYIYTVVWVWVGDGPHCSRNCIHTSAQPYLCHTCCKMPLADTM